MCRSCATFERIWSPRKHFKLSKNYAKIQCWTLSHQNFGLHIKKKMNERFLKFSRETVQTVELRSQIVKPVGPKCYYNVRGKDAAAFCSCPSIFSFWQKWPLYVSIGFYFKALLLRCAFQPFLYILFSGDDWVFARFLAHLHRTNSFGYLPHFRMELRPCAHKMGRKQ